jgi:predicted membrane protein
MKAIVLRFTRTAWDYFLPISILALIFIFNASPAVIAAYIFAIIFMYKVMYNIVRDLAKVKNQSIFDYVCDLLRKEETNG